MLSSGAALKRKSVEKVEPSLPRPKKLREPSTSGRTIYQQLKAPSEQLKQFRKKQLLTLGNLSTQKSQSNIKHEDYFTRKHSRFDDDHHNTESIAQLMESKLVSGGKTKIDSLGETHGETMREGHDTGLEGQPKESIQSASLIGKGSEEEEDGEPKEENYDDYVLGDKVEEDTPSEKPELQHKKYISDNDRRPLPSYRATTEAELRAEQLHWIGERRKLNQIKEDRQIVALMQEYQNNRQKVLNQSRKKHETARILAAAHRNYEKQQTKIQKSTSLPALKPKMEFIIEQAPILHQAQPWKSGNNLLAKGFSNQTTDKFIESRLRQSLSYGKLGFGRKKIRTICEQQIMQEEMNELQQIKGKLRSKGIAFDADKLKKGLVNMKKEPLFQQTDQYPEKKLPSNFIYKKFPL